jgi:hypothetical protein
LDLGRTLGLASSELVRGILELIKGEGPSLSKSSSCLSSSSSGASLMAVFNSNLLTAKAFVTPFLNLLVLGVATDLDDN